MYSWNCRSDTSRAQSGPLRASGSAGAWAGAGVENGPRSCPGAELVPSPSSPSPQHITRHRSGRDRNLRVTGGPVRVVGELRSSCLFCKMGPAVPASSPTLTLPGFEWNRLADQRSAALTRLLTLSPALHSFCASFGSSPELPPGTICLVSFLWDGSPSDFVLGASTPRLDSFRTALRQPCYLQDKGSLMVPSGAFSRLS